MVLGRVFTRFEGGAASGKGLYDGFSTRPSTCQKPPKMRRRTGVPANLNPLPSRPATSPPRRLPIRGSVIVTECDQSRTLSEICGCNLWLKFENLQFTSTFKERGALNRLLALSPDERRRGVIAMSAGNHAQGVAYHAHAARHSRHHRDARRHADGEDREHPASRRRGRSFPAKRWRMPPSSRASTARRKASPSSIPMTIRRSSRGRAPSRSRCWSSRRSSIRWWSRSAAAD